MAADLLIEGYGPMSARVEQRLRNHGIGSTFSYEEMRGAVERGELLVTKVPRGKRNRVFASPSELDAFADSIAAHSRVWRGSAPVEKGTPEPEAAE